MGDAPRKRRAETWDDPQNKRPHYDDRDLRNSSDSRRESVLSRDGDRGHRDQNRWGGQTRFSHPPQRHPKSPPRRPTSPPRRPQPPPRDPRPASRDPRLAPRDPLLPPARLQALTGAISSAIERKNHPINHDSNRSTTNREESWQKNISANSQEMVGESNQDSLALAERFLQGNSFLLIPDYGTRDHDRYEAHLQEVFKVPEFLTVRGLGAHPEVSSLVHAQEPAAMKQEAGIHDKDATSAQAVLLPACSGDATLSLEEQLPFLKIGQEEVISDEYSPPNLLTPIKPSLTNFQMAFFEGLFVFVDKEAVARLRAFGTGTLPKLLDHRDMLELEDKVVRQVVGKAPQLVPRSTLSDGNLGGLLKPSVNTTGREAFSWFVGPHLTLKERQALQGFWDVLPPFDPRMPNQDPNNDGSPATPLKTIDGLWDWTDSLQPIRWFFCPCCLRKHDCVYTGSHSMHCRGWKGVCCMLVCEHGPDTDLVHVGTVCRHMWDGEPCLRGRACDYQHGLEVTAKRIEHRLFHHHKSN